MSAQSKVESRVLTGRAAEVMNRKPKPWVIALIVIALLLIVLVSAMLGRYTIDPVTIVQTCAGLLWNAFADFMANFGVQLEHASVDAKAATALVNIRLPRILIVVLVGAALSVAGASYQGMFKNPMVSPDILGASAGASLGACLAMLLDLNTAWVQILAFVGAMAAVFLAVWLNRLMNKYDAILGLILGGMLVSSLFSAGTSTIKFLADANDKLPEITFWLMGGFNRTEGIDLLAIIGPMLAGFALLMFERGKLNVLSFGEEEAKSLGVNTRRVRLIVIFASTLVVACSVAVAGIIGWVGLVIPHLARSIVGPNYRVLLPTSMAIGAGFLLLVDNISRLVLSVEIPIGILTAIIGVPFFVFIFRRNVKGW